jgi:NTP pyrophosphatase (non-canonical NTP hydrolase)
MILHEMQKEVWENKIKRNFNTTDIGKEIILLTEELGELAKAYKHSNQMSAKKINNKDEMIDAVGDMMIYNLGLCEMFGVKAEEVLIDIIKKNKVRSHTGQMKK